MFTHFVFGSDDPAASQAFYDAVLPLLGFRRLDAGGAALAFEHERGFPRVVVRRPADGRPFRRGNGYHVAFLAPDEETVQRFHAAALDNGGSDEGGPGLRRLYAPDYYGAYLRDPDGNKLQAVTYLDGRKAGPGGDIVSHITLGTDDAGSVGPFYEGVLAALGLVRLPAEESENVDRAFGHAGCALPVIFPQTTFDGRPAAPSHGSHPVLRAPSRRAVEAFHREGLLLGGRELAPPAESPADGDDGGPAGFGAGLADPVGNALYARCPA